MRLVVRDRLARARAVEERRRNGEIAVLGPFSPGQGRQLVHEGALTGGFMWNPKQAGEVFVTLGKMVAEGQPIEAGMNIDGLGVVTPDDDGRDIIVDQLVEINAETVDVLAAMGL